MVVVMKPTLIGGKLVKLKSFLKRFHSFSKKQKITTTTTFHKPSPQFQPNTNKTTISDQDSLLRPVYVGQSRRQYLLSPDLVDHPLFQVLFDQEDPSMVVGCEVVLFDHLLWMLQNSDTNHESTLLDLVDFYSCC